MGTRYSQQNTYRDLSFGDVIKITAPFEENTTEYYNGYSPYEIRGDLVRDRFGRTEKQRPVMVIDVTSTELTYIPLTSSRGNDHDEAHQYQLEDNSMTPQHNWYRPVKTYAETASVRVIPINSDEIADYYGKIKEHDLAEIQKRLMEDAQDVYDGNDKHVYMGEKQMAAFINGLESHNYKKTIEDGLSVYSQDNRTFTLSESGVVKVHFELSVSQVRRRIERKEHIRLRPPSSARTKTHDTAFSSSLETLKSEMGDGLTYE